MTRDTVDSVGLLILYVFFCKCMYTDSVQHVLEKFNETKHSTRIG